MRFSMTAGSAVKVITALTVVIVLVALPVPVVLATKLLAGAPGPVRWLSLLPVVVVPVALGLAVLWAPRAVRVEADALVIERLAWSPFRLPLSEVASVEPGPELKLLSGDVWRVAGNGGLMGFTGLFKVKGVGVVRCWATRLDSPTVVVRRKGARPVLLGVDDGAGLLAALTAKVPRAA